MAAPDIGDTRVHFQRLPPEQTGLDFVAEWSPRPDSRDAERLDSHFAGGGVAIADFDGDRLPDVFLTRPFGGSRLYRNLGDFRFEDATAAAGLQEELTADHWGSGPTFADLDNDGDFDLYVCMYDRPNRLYINQGNGKFEERGKASGLDFRGSSVVMAFADYDLDGDLDGYLLTNRMYVDDDLRGEFIPEVRNGRVRPPEHLTELVDVVSKPNGALKVVAAGQHDRLFRNNGDLTFTDVSREAFGELYDAGYLGLSVRWWDYDSDRRPDLYVANDFWGPDLLLHNNGDGTFTDVARRLLPHTPWYSMGCDAIDLNNDGRLDFVASDMSATDHFKAKLNMGDMQDDGWFLEMGEPRQYMRNAVYLNTGGRFLEAAHLLNLDSTDWTWAVKSADFDNDGWVDLFFSNGMTRNWFNSDYRRPEGGPWQEEYADRWDQRPPLQEANLAFRNTGDFEFESVGAEWGLDHLGVTFGAAVGDLDGDGRLDLVMVDFDGPVRVYRNCGTAGQRIVVQLQGVVSNSRGVGAEVRLETKQGVQTRDAPTSSGFKSGDEPSLHFGLGDSDRIDRLIVAWPSGHRQEFENLIANRRYVITEPAGAPQPRLVEKQPTLFVETDAYQFARHVERPFDDFARQPLLPFRLSQLGPGLACGDVNGDQIEDLYQSGAAGQQGKLWLSTAEGFFRLADQGTPSLSEPEELSPLFIDADGDDDLDLLIIHGGVECEPNDVVLQDSLWLNDGRGSFSQAPLGSLPEQTQSGSVAAAADFDRDGDLDVFVGGRVTPGRYPEQPRSVLLRNDDGAFTDVTDQAARGLSSVGMATSALWTDVDGDDWIDLLVTCEWGPVRLYRNEQGQLVDQTTEAGLADRRGWWNGIAGGDLDRDGDVDYVVANAGLNTRYQASVERPATLFYGEVDDSGNKRIVEAAFEDGVLFPVRGRSCSTQAIPGLAERFPTFEQFARAALADVFDVDRLASADKLTANELSSGVLVNDGHGAFTFRSLPRLAQIAPAFGVAVADFNADGCPDIALAQNFYGPQPETGRFDGGIGLILLGDGSGGFQPLWPDRSGVEVVGDATALIVADLDQNYRPDLIFARNDHALAALKNVVEGKEFGGWAVRLRADQGNRRAVGARLTLEFDDRSRQVSEVYAGGGYLSQSSTTLFFANPAAASVRRATVRWPDGSSSQHEQPQGPLWEIVKPE